jgi:hypothetical protein
MWDHLTFEQKTLISLKLEENGVLPEGATEKMKQEEYDKQLEKQSIIAAAKRLGITEEKVIAMRKYAKALQVKQPQMKPLRVQRKVAEYFKVKIS